MNMLNYLDLIITCCMYIEKCYTVPHKTIQIIICQSKIKLGKKCSSVILCWPTTVNLGFNPSRQNKQTKTYKAYMCVGFRYVYVQLCLPAYYIWKSDAGRSDVSLCPSPLGFLRQPLSEARARCLYWLTSHPWDLPLSSQYPAQILSWCWDPNSSPQNCSANTLSMESSA